MLLRRLRAVLIIGILWGAVWAPLGIGWATIFHLREGPKFTVVVVATHPFYSDWPAWIGIYAGFGLVAGTLFAVIVAFVEARRTLHGLSPRRLSLWGAAAAAAVPLTMAVPDLVRSPESYSAPMALAVSAFILLALVAGVACARATLSVALARAGSEPQGQLA